MYFVWKRTFLNYEFIRLNTKTILFVQLCNQSRNFAIYPFESTYLSLLSKKKEEEKKKGQFTYEFVLNLYNFLKFQTFLFNEMNHVLKNLHFFKLSFNFFFSFDVKVTTQEKCWINEIINNVIFFDVRNRIFFLY